MKASQTNRGTDKQVMCISTFTKINAVKCKGRDFPPSKRLTLFHLNNCSSYKEVKFYNVSLKKESFHSDHPVTPQFNLVTLRKGPNP